MDFLVFDNNLYNSLKVAGFRNVFCFSEDGSVFYITDEIETLEICSKAVTILYSFSPKEICGLYMFVDYFKNKDVEIFISQPKLDNNYIFSYSDCDPKSLKRLIESESQLLSKTDIMLISDKWKEIIKSQTNLRIWLDNRLQNVDDSYFDKDIKYILKKYETGYCEDLLFELQLLLRNKYHYGLNPQFIRWRIEMINNICLRGENKC